MRIYLIQSAGAARRPQGISKSIGSSQQLVERA